MIHKNNLETLICYNLLYKAEKPSVCLSVLIFWHAAISVVSASIETGLARNESCVIEED